MKNSNVLFVDIETVSSYPVFEELDDRWKSLFELKMNYFHSKEPEKAFSDWYKEKAAIFAEFGKIVCIGTGFFNENGLRIKTFSGHDEKELMMSFFELVSHHFNNPNKHILCGHNIREFDLPYLCRRAAVHGLQLPRTLDLSFKKPWEIKHLIDTMELWKFGDYKNYVSLDLLSACLGLESPKEQMNGSQVGSVYYDENDLPKISNYCAGDVWVTANVYLKLNRQETVPFEEVFFV